MLIKLLRVWQETFNDHGYSYYECSCPAVYVEHHSELPWTEVTSEEYAILREIVSNTGKYILIEPVETHDEIRSIISSYQEEKAEKSAAEAKKQASLMKRRATIEAKKANRIS